MTLCVLLFVVTVASVSCGVTDYAYIQMQTFPERILPVLTKKLQVRCSVKNDNWKAQVKSTALPLPRDVTTNQPLWNNTEALTDTASSQSSKSKAATDFSRLLSLVITKTNKDTGLNVTIASVTGCDSPVIEAPFVGEVQVVGSTEGSPQDGEQGYISVTWDRPQERNAGVFNCEAYAQNPAKHSVSLTASLEIKAVDPKTSDLVSYISTNEKLISQLKFKVSEIYYENQKLKQESKLIADKYVDVQNRVGQLKSQNVQFGSSPCGDKTVQFSPPFNSTPRVFTSLTSFSFASSFSYSMFVNSITNTSFYVNCRLLGNYASASFDWWAIDV